MRGRMGEADTIRGVWLAALAIFGRHPLAVLGAIGEVPAYLIDGRPLLDQVLTLVTAYVAYYLYLAYAEGIVRRAQWGVQGPGLPSVLDGSNQLSRGGGDPRGRARGRVGYGVAHVGAWAGGSIVATLVVPLAAFATSLAHSSVPSRT
jgi:hypothetical protein